MRHNVQRIVVVLLGSSLAALGQRAPAPDSATITATTRLVYEDVVVRDSQGRVVHGLTLNDFKLKEDGASQQIDYFDEYTYASPAAQKSAAAMPIPSMNARQANPITDFTNAPAPGAVHRSTRRFSRRQRWGFHGSFPEQTSSAPQDIMLVGFRRRGARRKPHA